MLAIRRISEEDTLIDHTAATAGAPALKACASPLEGVEYFEPPRDESVFGLPEGSWPNTGRPYATWVDPA